MDQEAAEKDVFPEGHSSFLPVPAEEAEAMQATGTAVLSRPREVHHGKVYEFFRTDSDAVGETTTSLPNPQRTTSVLASQDVRRRCTAATVVFLLLAVLLCGVVVWRRRKRKEHLPAASGAQPETDACP
ncbi:uncharacterized protein J5F26_010072 [Ciconia maguari]